MSREIDTGEYIARMYKWAVGRTDVRPKHLALYGYLMTCVREFRKDCFAIKTEFAMMSSMISNAQSYRKAMEDLDAWGFVKIVSKGRNQWALTEIKILDFDPDSGLKAYKESVTLSGAVKIAHEGGKTDEGAGGAQPVRDGKKLYGRHVRLTEKEYRGMLDEYGEEFTQMCIRKLDDYIPNAARPYRDHRAVMNAWVIKSVKKDMRDEQREREQRDRSYGGLQKEIRDDACGQTRYGDTIPDEVIT